MTRVQKSLIILSVAIVLIFGIVIYRQLPVGDYQHHLDWAKELADKGYIYRPPNNLFQNLVVITRPLLPFRVFTIISPYLKNIIDKRSYDMVALLLMVAALVVTALVIYKRFNDILDEFRKKASTVVAYRVDIGPNACWAYILLHNARTDVPGVCHRQCLP